MTNDGPQEFSDTICEGETYRKYGFNETKSGDYSTTISNGNCSTEVILHLTVAPKYKQEFNDVACLGQVYNKHGFTMTPFVKGEFHDTLTFLSHMGCDSMVILNLNVKPITYDTITRRICQNEHYKDANFDIAVNQNTGLSYYTVEKSKEDGCKSYLTLALQVDSVYQVTVVEDFEKSGSFNQYGFNIDEMKPGNNYRLELSTGNGCDSIVTLCFRLPADIDVDIDVDKDDRVIPTAFTPHFQDDMNDHFMPGYEVYIYDRYGNLVCHSEDGWDGTYRGEVATAGIYVYAVVMKDGEMRKGTIEVVKSK
ncbi:MAG: gliding motility-associated C-terminal domain-containing protein [Paludibacteraceae bacterium]|nr:gliding motility-associated C-terminal domain-containing protein [Paludibacteraceae bacterium]